MGKGDVTINKFYSRHCDSLVVVQSEIYPIGHVGWGSDCLGSKMDVAFVDASAHGYRRTAFFLNHRLMQRRVDPAHHAVGTGGEAHFAIDHECQSAKHLFFLHLRQVCQRPSYEVRYMFAVSHV